MARTVAEIQADINAEQNAVGSGNWNSTLNSLVAERDAASNNTGGGTVGGAITSTVAAGKNLIAGVKSAVFDVGAAAFSDIQMGISKLTGMGEAKFEEKYGSGSWTDFTSRTEVTSAVTKGDPTGLTAAQKLSYDKKMALKNAGKSYGNDDAPAAAFEDVLGDGSSAEPELSYAEKILEWAESSGHAKSEQDMKDIIADPNKWMADNGFNVKDELPELDPDAEGTTIDATNELYTLDDLTLDPTKTIDTDELVQVDELNATDGTTYTAKTNTLTEDEMAVAVKGTVTDDMLVTAEQIDMDGSATGVNEDGSVNQTGLALNEYAYQDTTNMIDLSTESGRELARQLGEGNYTDKRSSYLGQLEIISRQFVNENGETIIPPWAKSLANTVAATMAYDGITGSAQTMAMATAIMEATLVVADKEATLFATIAENNLSNRQESVINKATVLAQFDIANLDARSVAAVENAKAFLKVNLQNLTAAQQVEIVNKQARTQALFESTKEINLARRFSADTANDMAKFYAEQNIVIQRHNTAEINALKKFNAGEINDASQFQADIKNNRDQFYANMRFQIDTAVARWRQDVVKTKYATEWEATTTDVKNALNLTTETMSTLWDSTDSTLDMIAKLSASDQELVTRLAIAQIQAQSGRSDSGGGIFGMIAQLGGAFLSTTAGAEWLVGA